MYPFGQTKTTNASRRRRMRRYCSALVLSFPGVLAWPQAHSEPTAADLIKMDLADLVNMKVEIRSAGKTASRALDLPYAAHVVTSTDIRNSGAQTLPDVLRLVPGIAVNQISAAEWSVAIRAGGGRFSGYVLVLVNGRTAYKTEFGGVNWDELNLPLESIDRIEIIRGPNAASWGPNAVNGVINIITQSPNHNRSTSARVWSGSSKHSGIAFSNSSLSTDNWSVDVNGHWRQWDGLDYIAELDQEDKHQDWRFSASVSNNDGDARTAFSTELFSTRQSPYYGLTDPTIPSPLYVPLDEKVSGGIAQMEIVRPLGSRQQWKLRASLDHTDRTATIHRWHTNNLQLDWELNGTWGNHRWITGINTSFNDTKVQTLPPQTGRIEPPKDTFQQTGAFASDVIDLSERLQLTLSLRVDHNELTDTSYQPSTRFSWSINDNSRFWGAASRASATPSRLVSDFVDVPVFLLEAQGPAMPLPLVAEFSGDPEPENTTYVDALEAGYRHAFDNFNIDIALFNFDYHDAPTVAQSGPPQVRLDQNLQPIAVFVESTLIYAHDYSKRGIEISSRAQPYPFWSLQLAYSAVRDPERREQLNTNLSLMNTFHLNSNLDLSVWLRHNHGPVTYSDDLVFVSEEFGNTDNYYQLDFNLHWQLRSKLSVSFIANNLGRKHVEAPREAFSTYAAEVEPYFLIKLDKRF